MKIFNRRQQIEAADGAINLVDAGTNQSASPTCATTAHPKSTHSRWRSIAAAMAMVTVAGIGMAPAAMADSGSASAATGITATATAGTQISPTDVVSGAYDAYKWYADCQANMKDHKPCIEDRQQAQFEQLTSQINALSQQITAENAHISDEIGAVSNRVRKEQLNDAYRSLGPDLTDMVIVSAKVNDYQNCLAALNTTSHNQMPGGNGQVATCTLTLANGNPELDPATNQPKQFPMASTDDFAKGPQERLYDATVKASWGSPNAPTDKAAVYGAFSNKGQKIAQAMAGSSQNEGSGLLPISFHYTIESGYLQDSNEKVAPDGIAPAYVSGDTVNQINRFNNYFVGLQTNYWVGVETAMQMVQSGWTPPAAADGSAAPAQEATPAQEAAPAPTTTPAAPDASTPAPTPAPTPARATTKVGDDDWAATLRNTAVNGVATQPNQALAAQASNWSLPVWSTDHTTLSSANVADASTGFFLPWTDPGNHGNIDAYQTTRATHVTLDGDTSNAAPADPSIPTKSLLDTESNRMISQGYAYSTLVKNHPNALPTTMWANMGNQTEKINENEASFDPGSYNDHGTSTTMTTAWPSDATKPGNQAPGTLINGSTKTDQACVAPVKFYDSRPSLSQVAGDLNAKPWPSYRKNTDYEPGGYHQTVYSGYQMFNKSQHMWVQPATGGRSYGQNMNGEDLYNTMNPSAVVPVYDVLWSQTGAGYHDDPLYSGDGLGYAMRCGGADHVAASHGFLKPSATDTLQVNPIATSTAPGGNVGGWAKLMG